MTSHKKTALLFLILVSIDQLSKYIIRSTGGFYICNRNIAFGLKMPEIIFWLFWTGIVFLLLLSIGKKNGHNTLYLMLILAGAIANIIDRFRYGCVIDFLDLKFWPVFNLADVYITIGVIIILIGSLKLETKD